MAAYDYIVVGGGSAGAVLAARLSENASVNVLLLEAGPDYRAAETPPEMRSPNFIEIVLRGGYHWPNLYARLNQAQKVKLYLRGFGLGGSSAINATGAIRGLPGDFDSWEKQGCVGWSWNDVLPSFIRLEDDLDYGDRPHHGKGGPIPITRTRLDRAGAVGHAFVEAALDLGHPWCEDINAPGATGVHPGTLNVRDGARVSTNDAYLEPARDRSNLKIVGNALVDRVEFDGMRAIGVRTRTKESSVLWEAGEVVLCAGAIHSPAILMRSGIGIAGDLQRLGLSPIVELPGVGQNLGEHPVVQLTLALRPAARAPSLRAAPFGCGLRAGSGQALPDDVGMFAGSFGASLAEGAIGVAIVQPFSRGHLRLRSPDPNVNPWIEFNMLNDERDLARLRHAVRHAFRLARHRAFAAVSEAVSAPGLTDEILAADPPFDEWLRANCEEFFHAVGTCRMGSRDDPRSVVDSDCRVIGLEALRVADASIMPDPPRAATHLTTVMIAEHLAARLRRTADRRKS